VITLLTGVYEITSKKEGPKFEAFFFTHL